jgi:hypothetical protein
MRRLRPPGGEMERAGGQPGTAARVHRAGADRLFCDIKNLV